MFVSHKILRKKINKNGFFLFGFIIKYIKEIKI